MLKPAVVLLLSCAACSQARTPSDQPGAAARAYATQVETPSPDYDAMLAGRRAAPPIGEVVREASAPLPADAKALGELWIGRLEQRGALMGHGLAGKGEDDAVSSIDTLLTAREFDVWVRENAWAVPAHIDWRFQNELTSARVSGRAAAKIRYWPASVTRTGWQLQAAEAGRVFVRDGCFFVRRFDASEKLAWFHAETGLDVDEEGFLVLIDRATGETTARVGEDMTWAGPNAIAQDDPRLAPLHEACGPGEVHGVGNPQAQERMYVRYPHLRNPVQPPPPASAD